MTPCALEHRASCNFDRQSFVVVKERVPDLVSVLFACSKINILDHEDLSCIADASSPTSTRCSFERANKVAKPDVKPRQMLSASSGVVRLGVVASGYRNIASHVHCRRCTQNGSI